jgi:predicted DCC family thiol-disulfide oxidoreductase YuxK
VLFDGVCHLCQGSVRFIADRDPRARFRFAPLQSATGAALLERHGLSGGLVDSLVLIDGGQAYTRSAAALRIAGRLGGGWRLAPILLLVPAFLRDWLYDVVARYRYRWFGRSESCEIPSESVRARLVTDEDDAAALRSSHLRPG